MSNRQLADWSTEALIDYEHRLYDDEVAGEDTWRDREEVLAELRHREADAAAGGKSMARRGWI